jgi:endonuclease/exonuclease/phosphatase family metal-dependent hydrolase
LVSICAHAARAQETAAEPQGRRFEDPSFLSFDELVALSSTAKPTGQLAVRLDKILTIPFVHNDATAAGAEPHRPTVENLGPVVRVGFWNIERGLNFDLIQAALTDTDDFERLAGDQSHISGPRRALIESQLHDLQSADVLVLNEVDMGMKRSEYRDVARELAAALRMNYAYGAEFVEVDPIFALGIEEVHLEDPQEDTRLQRDLYVDHERYLGLHGTAILSRYPIRSARVLRLPMCYDWFGKEAKEAAKLEKGKRWAAKRLFGERIEREVRQGGRMALIVDVAAPDSPTGEATIVATHLENKCAPSCRKKQMAALLENLKDDNNPLVVAGDLNTTGKNNTPTSVRNEVMSRVTRIFIRSEFTSLRSTRFAIFTVTTIRQL